MKLQVFVMLSLLSIGAFSRAGVPPTAGWLRAESLGWVTSTAEEIVRGVSGGDVIVIGEVHGQSQSQQGQLEILRALRHRGDLRVHVGFEFFEYPKQNFIEPFRAGTLTEPDFLTSVRWGKGFSFEFYRDQVLFPSSVLNEKVFALNSPREVTSQVAKTGLESLPSDLGAFLPPGLQKGNSDYFDRFVATVGHLPSPEAADRYFWAQSIWDDTMAWKATEILAQDPGSVLVVVVGEFHVQYGGGLPDRLKARGLNRVWTISELDLRGLTEAEVQQEIQIHPKWGMRADALWIFDEGRIERPSF